MSKQRTALFGGTFDPVHLGHTIVAAIAIENIGAEVVIFVPARCSPLKMLLPKASDEHRVEMLKLATKSEARFQVNDYELNKAEPGYTLETVRYFKRKYGSGAEIYWLVGADTFEELGLWYKITELIDECNLSVMYRAGFGVPDFSRFENLWGKNRVGKLQNNMIETPLVDISSTEIRRRLAVGEDVSEMLAPEVAEYIRRHNLYV